MKTDRYGSIHLLLVLALVSVVASCKPTYTPTTTVVPPIKPEHTPTPTPVAGEPEPPTAEPMLSGCPEADWLYQLDYTHSLVLDQPGQFHLEMVAEPGAAFYLVIHEDGTIDSQDLENAVTVVFTGTIQDCEVHGENTLSADIFGLCADGMATLQINEYYAQGFLFTETCPEGTGTLGLESLVSAPENQFDFDLRQESDQQVVEMDAGMLSFRYTWTLREYGMMPIPLIPQAQE